MTSAVPLLKSVMGSRWNFLAMCSRTRDMPGGISPPPLVAGKRRKKTVAGTRVNKFTVEHVLKFGDDRLSDLRAYAEKKNKK